VATTAAHPRVSFSCVGFLAARCCAPPDACAGGDVGGLPPESFTCNLSNGHLFEKDALIPRQFATNRRSTEVPCTDRILDVGLVFGTNPAPIGYEKVTTTLNRHTANLTEVRAQRRHPPPLLVFSIIPGLALPAAPPHSNLGYPVCRAVLLATFPCALPCYWLAYFPCALPCGGLSRCERTPCALRWDVFFCQGVIGAEPVFLCVRRGEVGEDVDTPGPVCDIALVVVGVESVPEGYTAVETSLDGKAAIISSNPSGAKWMLCYKRLPAGSPDSATAVSDIDVIWVDKNEKPAEVRRERWWWRFPCPRMQLCSARCARPPLDLLLDDSCGVAA
jgi:hypothetical protein